MLENEEEFQKETRKTHKFNVTCDKCGKLITRSKESILKQRDFIHGDFCAACSQVKQYELGLRKSCFAEYNKLQTGKTWEERFGIEKAKIAKEKMSKANSGSNNSMYGDYEHTKGWRKHNEEIKGKTFEEFYGEERAKELKKVYSLNASGKNNSMYGKPAPIGSGNGWSGWYNGIHFRSLLELAFLVKNPNAKSAESYKIPYIDYFGHERTYHPDFEIDNAVYEIKPYKLQESPLNKLKFEAAVNFFNDIGKSFKILTEKDFEKISFQEIKDLHDKGSLKFLERYENKLKTYENKQGGSPL